MCFAPQRRALCRRLNFQKCSEPGVFCTFWLGNVLRATAAYTFSTSWSEHLVLLTFWLGKMCFAPQRRALFRRLNFQKCSEPGFWLGNVLRATAAYTFDISTSKSVPILVWFVHFDLEICFAPTQRALFWHLNFQKWTETVSFLHFWLRQVLRATTACNFSSLIWPDGSAPAAFASLLFNPPEPQIIGKTQCVAPLLPFRAPASSFLRLFLFSDLHFSSLLSSPLLFSPLLCLFPPLLFHLLSEVWLLNFHR